MNDKEIWRDIEEFKEYYQVSNFGRVKRIGNYSNQCSNWKSNDKILSLKNNGRGYLTVCLCINNKHYYRYVHRLVALAFCDNSKNYKEVNHIDGDKTNNYYNNLEWCDRSYNNKHAYKLKLRSVKGCYGKKKKVAQIDLTENKVINIYDSVENAAKSVGLKNFCNISACCNYAKFPQKYKRPILTSKGYKWRFATPNMKIGDVIND